MKAQIIFQGLGQGGQGGQAHHFTAEDRNPVTGRLHADRFKDPVNGILPIIGDVHGHLDDPFFLELDAAGLDVLEATPRLADGPGDLVGDLDIIRTQIDVVGDQGEAGPDSRDPGRGMDLSLAKVRFPFGQEEFLRHALKLAPADLGQVDPVRRGGRVFIKEDGDVKTLVDLPGQIPGQVHRFFHGHVTDGDQGHHVSGPHA